MATLDSFCTVSLSLLIVFQSVNGFNVDVTVPIVKEGRTESYFGFSVAQHHIHDSLDPSRDEKVILVGAPLDNISLSSATDEDLDLVKPGVIYSCPVTSRRSDCRELKISEPSGGADKNGKWLGVTVASQGTEEGRAVACAHRYSKAGFGHRWGQGICTILSNSLVEGQLLEPCEGKDLSTGHSAFGMCQSGTSLDISDDGDVLIGSPGPYDWRGSISKNILEQTFDEDFGFYSSPVESPRKPPIPETPDPVPKDFFSYLGMSSAIGTILNGEKTYIGGATHSKDLGQVMLFTQSETGNIYLEIRQTLTGDQLGAGFGYSLEVLDLNNDTKQDLVVGAPFYHAVGRGGAIYVYMNGDDGITSETEPLKILSPKMSQEDCEQFGCQLGQFGLSLAALGDLDRDGYEDLAVGAPFEGDGAVYIFRGSANGLIQKHSQRIQPSHMSLLPDQPMKTFGSSLKGGMDMDDNGYPDLVVGAFDSNKALILRTRPVIDVTTYYSLNPQVIDTSVDVCDKTKNTGNCFDIKICFKFTAEPENRFTSKIKLIYKIEAEPNRKVSRVSFENATKTKGRKIKSDIVLNKQTNPNPSCADHRLYLTNNVQDVVNSIYLQLTYELEARQVPTMTPGSPLPDLDQHAVVDRAKAVVNILVPFKKDCGDDNECQSQLVLKGSIPKLDKDETGDHLILKLGFIDRLQVVAVVRNEGEDAHETALNFVLPDKFYFVNASKDDERISCKGNQSLWTCPVGNPLKRNETVLKLDLDPKDITDVGQLLEIRMSVNTTSEEMDVTDNVVKLIMKVTTETDLKITGFSDPFEVPYGGKIVDESAIKNEDQIGNVVYHNFVVSNGPGFVNSVSVRILWPHQVEHGRPEGKKLLYLLEDPLIEPPGKCFVSPDRVNPLGVKLKPRVGKLQKQQQQTPTSTERQSRRVKREKIIKAQEVKNPDTGKMENVVILDCGRATAKCFTIDCVITPMEKNTDIEIKLRSRLWNNTFLEDYRDIDHVKIFAEARIEIDPKLVILQNTTDNDIYTIETQAVPDIAVQKRPGIPLWLIIVAALVGLLLLILLILILWKCRFFKRNRVEDNIPDYKGTLLKKKKKDNYYGHPYIVK